MYLCVCEKREIERIPAHFYYIIHLSIFLSLSLLMRADSIPHEKRM